MNTRKNPTSKQDVAQDMKQKADQASQEMKAKGREQIEEQESEAAEAMDKMADATQAAARELEQRNAPTLSHYVSEVADGINSLSNNLRHKNTDELIHEASRLAKENAGLFLLGSVAVGFGLSRIAKAGQSATASHGQQTWEDFYGRQETTSYGADTRTQQSPAAAGATSSTGTSNPTHASTSYLPEDRERESAESPINNPPNAGARGTQNNPPGDAGRSTS